MVSDKIKSFIMRNWVLYFVGFIIVFGIKYFYSKAGSDELEWILAPTAWWVKTLSGIAFDRESHVGYINHTFRFIIAPSCSGVQFMTVTFATILFSFVHRMRTMKMKFCWAALSVGFSYLFTVFVNGFRIIFAIYLPLYIHRSDIGGGWLTSERIHTIEGTVVYFVSLLIIYRIAGYASRKIACLPEEVLSRNRSEQPGNPLLRIIRKCVPPMFWYFFITLGIPFINGAYKNDGKKFIEYAILMTAVCAATVFLFCLAYVFKERRRSDS